MLAYEHRLKAATAVSWSRDLKIACVTADCLFSMTIALVWLISLFMLGVT